ncbi:MAG: hypothetical protein ACTSXD_06860 [Candidatus Heimdallarchaeaceae archaeon]
MAKIKNIGKKLRGLYCGVCKRQLGTPLYDAPGKFKPTGNCLGGLLDNCVCGAVGNVYILTLDNEKLDYVGEGRTIQVKEEDMLKLGSEKEHTYKNVSSKTEPNVKSKNK